MSWHYLQELEEEFSVEKYLAGIRSERSKLNDTRENACCPCQDISAAGKGAGIDGARSGLWAEMFRIICEVRPRFAFMENSPMLTYRGLHRVLGDLAAAGYDAAWMVLGAADVGAPLS